MEISWLEEGVEEEEESYVQQIFVMLHRNFLMWKLQDHRGDFQYHKLKDKEHVMSLKRLEGDTQKAGKKTCFPLISSLQQGWEIQNWTRRIEGHIIAVADLSRVVEGSVVTRHVWTSWHSLLPVCTWQGGLLQDPSRKLLRYLKPNYWKEKFSHNWCNRLERTERVTPSHNNTDQ